ncbi:MAG: GNAT family N-acetyltransferase [Phaeodactylibacter sp.]|nr:GNAT family N-acetyltransferase [Phaeodactylibacter sp.]
MKFRKVSEEEWLDFLKDCDSATFFHTPYWYKVWKAYAGYNYEARIYEFPDDRQILLPLAWWRIKKGLLKRMVSSPAGTYGGWIAKQTVSREEAASILKSLKKEFSHIHIRLNGMQKQPVCGLAKVEEDFTLVISLQNKVDFTSVLKEWTKGHVSAAKRGAKGPLEVFPAFGKESIEAYYPAYLESLARWGSKATSKYGRKIFEYIFDLVPLKYFRLWLAKADGDLAYGCLCFYFNNHVVYWHGAGKSDFFHLKPAHLLQYRIIEDAMASGYWWYDFNPSGGHEGVVRFKKGFGAKKIIADNIIYESGLISFFLKG